MHNLFYSVRIHAQAVLFSQNTCTRCFIQSEYMHNLFYSVRIHAQAVFIQSEYMHTLFYSVRIHAHAVLFRATLQQQQLDDPSAPFYSFFVFDSPFPFALCLTPDISRSPHPTPITLPSPQLHSVQSCNLTKASSTPHSFCFSLEVAVY